MKTMEAAAQPAGECPCLLAGGFLIGAAQVPQLIPRAGPGGLRAELAEQLGASPRGSLALLLLSRARAALAGRDFVVPEDVKYVSVPALAHRITLRPEMWLRRIDPAAIVAEVVARTPAPASGAVPTYAGAAPAGGADPYRYTAPPRG